MKSNRTIFLCLIAVIILAVALSIPLIAGTTGIIAGYITDAETGEPLAGANVIVEGTRLTTVTNESGYFAITNVPPGDYRVKAELIGYGVSVLGDVSVTMDATAMLEFELAQELLEEEEAVVTLPAPMISPDVVQTLNVMTEKQYMLARAEPAWQDSVGSILSVTPGVIIDPDGTGVPHFRGARGDMTGWYVDGISVIDPNSMSWGTNMFTTGSKSFQVYTGGYGAQYGNATAGVMNEVKKTGPDAPGINLDALVGGEQTRSSYLEIGGGMPDTFNYYIANKLFTGDIDNPMIQSQEFADNVAKLVWPWENDSITFLVLQGSLAGYLSNYHDVGNYREPVPREKDYIRQRYAVTALTWNHSFSPEAFVTVKPYYGYWSLAHNLMGASTGAPVYVDVWSKRWGLQVDYTNQLNEKHLLKAGGSLLDSNNNYYLYCYIDGMGVYSPYHYQNDVDTLQKSLYIQDQYKLNDKWTMEAGLRYDSCKYNRTGNAFDENTGDYTGPLVPDVTEAIITPRLGFSYAQNDNTLWKANLGRYSRFVPAWVMQRIYFNPSDMFAAEATSPGAGADSAPEGSTIYEISYEKQLSDTLAFRVTPFYQKYENLVDRSTDENGLSRFRALGEGESKGVEFFVKKRMSDNFEGWLSYTYMTAKAGRPDQNVFTPEYYTTWDQRHTLSLVGNYNTGKWSHALRVDFGSGIADNAVAVDPSLQDRANAYSVVTYTLSVDLPEDSSIGDTAYLNIYNLFNTHETTRYNWADETTRNREAWVPGRVISFGVTRDF